MDADELRRLRLAALLMAARDEAPVAQTLALQVGAEIDRWMAWRGVSWDALAVNRGTLSRCLKGDNVTLKSVAEVAGALGCDPVIHFVPRWPGSTIYRTTPLSAPADVPYPDSAHSHASSGKDGDDDEESNTDA